MRFTSIFLAALLAATTGCGNDNKPETNPLPPLELPPIVQGPANDVSYAEGELLDGFAFAKDNANSRTIIADTAQGIVSVDDATQALTILFPIGQQDEADTVYIQRITDIALDEAKGILYILDTSAKQILAADLASLSLTVIATEDDFTIGDKFIWSVPTSIVFDDVNQRLLIIDSSGLQNASNAAEGQVQVNAFCLYAYSLSDKKVTVVSEAANLAAPLAYRGVKTFYYDEPNNRIFTSGVYYPGSNPNNAIQQVAIIDLSDWTSNSIYLGTVATSSASLQHGVSYDSALNTVYFLESNAGNILNIELTDLDADLEYNFTVNNARLQDYILLTPTYLSLIDDNLWVYDAANRALFSVEREDGERTLIFNGAPITPSILDRPIYPSYVGVAQDSQQAFIVDDLNSQRDALTIEDSSFGKFPFTVDLTGITGVELKLNPPEEGETITPPSQTEPKIVSSQITPSGGLMTFNAFFERETDDELVRNIYYSTFYLREPEGTSAKPIFTSTANGTTSIIDLARYARFYDSAITSANLTSYVTQFAASDSDIIMVVSNRYLYRLNYVTTNDNEKIRIVNGLGTYTPVSIKGISFNPNNGEYLIIDSFHDALLSLNLTDNTITPISGRETASDVYLGLTSGLAFDESTNTAYTYESAIKAVVAIDVTTGERTRLDSDVNYLRSAGNLTLSADKSKLYIVDRILRRVVEFDLATHNQRWVDENLQPAI